MQCCRFGDMLDAVPKVIRCYIMIAEVYYADVKVTDLLNVTRLKRSVRRG